MSQPPAPRRRSSPKKPASLSAITGLLFEERTWSNFQLDIFNEVETGHDNIAVVARAGTGKSTLIEEVTKRLPAGKRCLVVAFNRDTAAELAGRVRRGCDVMTCNGLGHRALHAAFGAKKPESEKWVRELLRRSGYFPSRSDGHKRTEIVKIVSRAKNTLASSPQEINRLITRLRVDPFMLLEESERGVEESEAQRLGRFRIIKTVQGVLEVCKAEVPKSEIIDFDDQIWLPHALGLPVGQWDWVIVDEAQDLNLAQIDMLSKAVAPGGRFMAVGDPRQAIYAFRGADPHAFELLIQRFKARVFSLPVTYRCAQRIVEQAQALVPDFQAAPGSPEGEVYSVPSLPMDEVRPGDFILSRKNAPLIHLCFQALAAGIPALLTGRDIGRELLRLIKDAEEELGWQAGEDAVRVRVLERLAKQIQRRLDDDDDASDLVDRRDCLVALYNAKETTSEVVEALGLLFADRDFEGKAVFSSAHRAKGLEADRVWMLQSTFKPGANEEEDNLFYVAQTRAKRTLIYVENEA